jgi:phenylpyruvate tautomerase
LNTRLIPFYIELSRHILFVLCKDQNMTFGGTNEPCAYVTLMSIGRLGIEENKKHSNAIMNELEKLLEIPPSRVCFIIFIHL